MTPRIHTLTYTDTLLQYTYTFCNPFHIMNACDFSFFFFSCCGNKFCKSFEIFGEEKECLLVDLKWTKHKKKKAHFNSSINADIHREKETSLLHVLTQFALISANFLQCFGVKWVAILFAHLLMRWLGKNINVMVPNYKVLCP